MEKAASESDFEENEDEGEIHGEEELEEIKVDTNEDMPNQRGLFTHALRGLGGHVLYAKTSDCCLFVRSIPLWLFICHTKYPFYGV